MRVIWIVATVFPLLTVMATAQEELAPIPKAEVFANYSYLRAGPSPGYGAANIAPGFGVAGVVNMNRWLGLVIDTGHHFGQQDVIPATPRGITEVNYTLHTLMEGPRFTYWRNERITPFASVLIGGARLYRGYGPTTSSTTAGSTTPGTTSSGTTTPSSTAPGPTTPDYGGSTGVTYRLTEAEYLMLRPDGLSGKGVNTLRLSTGISFRFGSK